MPPVGIKQVREINMSASTELGACSVCHRATLAPEDVPISVYFSGAILAKAWVIMPAISCAECDPLFSGDAPKPGNSIAITLHF